MAITSERKINLLCEMHHILRKDFPPDDAFERIADEACISGKDRRQLKKEWKESIWVENWFKAHPKTNSEDLCW